MQVFSVAATMTTAKGPSCRSSTTWSVLQMSECVRCIDVPALACSDKARGVIRGAADDLSTSAA